VIQASAIVAGVAGNPLGSLQGLKKVLQVLQALH
jgi:hypothetical protein